LRISQALLKGSTLWLERQVADADRPERGQAPLHVTVAERRFFGG